MYNMICCNPTLLLFIIQMLYHANCYIRDFRSFNKNVSQTLDNLLANNRYDKRIRPDIGGQPTIVTVNMYIKSIGPISEIEQMYTMDVYFRQTWYDKRLSFNLPGLNEFSMSWLFLDKVWKPDTYFTNGKKSYLHRITSPNKFLRIRNDGFLTYSTRLTISATCQMFLKKFPMDTQRCPLQMGSYGYTSKDVLYVWHQDGVGLEPGMELAQYDLVNVTTKDKMTDIRGTMDFSVIKATFILKRNLGYFVLQMYVPCILMVCCSWVNFWIDPDATPARVQLSVTSVLSITTLGFVGRSALPKVPYPTALDWFIILCYIFVFAVMVEYAVINFIDKVTEDIKKILQDREKKKKIVTINILASVKLWHQLLDLSLQMTRKVSDEMNVSSYIQSNVLNMSAAFYYAENLQSTEHTLNCIDEGESVAIGETKELKLKTIKNDLTFFNF